MVNSEDVPLSAVKEVWIFYLYDRDRDIIGCCESLSTA